MKAFLIALLLPLSALASITIEGTTDTLEIVTGSAGSIDYHVSWTNVTTTAITTPGTSSGNITTAATTTVVAAPAASNWRYIRELTIENASATISNAITIQIDRSAANRVLWSGTLQVGEHLTLDDSGDINVHDATGALKTALNAPASGLNFVYEKIGATSEAAGLWQAQAKDTGFPGAWVPGTPGVNGDALGCDASADAIIAGAPLLSNPSTGGYYLSTYSEAASVVHYARLVDLLWYNTGLVVTTTTSQTFTPPTLPSRDNYGTTNGDGWQAAILVTTATTNAGTTAPTLQYTASDGTAGRTGTIAAFPITAVAGVFYPFTLQAGDRGVRTITGVTLNTSLVTGAISIVLFRPLAAVPVPLANVGALAVVGMNGRIWNGTCFWNTYLASTTTATNSYGQFSLVVK